MSGLVTGLQNRLQRFESASDLTNSNIRETSTLVEVFLFYRPSANKLATTDITKNSCEVLEYNNHDAHYSPWEKGLRG